MKQKLVLIVAAAGLFSSGCVVATQYQKSVTVTKDADGKIVSTVETESVIQPQQRGYPVKFDYLKGVRTNEQK